MTPVMWLVLALAVPVVLALWLVRAQQAKLRREERLTQYQREVLDGLAQRLGARAKAEDGSPLQGTLEGRTVEIVVHPRPESGAPGAFGIELRIACDLSSLPPAIVICEFADGPYQKYEEILGGRAHESGDRSFDAWFIVQGDAEGARSIPAALRGAIVRDRLESMKVDRSHLHLFTGPDAGLTAVLDLAHSGVAIATRLEAADAAASGSAAPPGA